MKSRGDRLTDKLLVTCKGHKVGDVLAAAFTLIANAVASGNSVKHREALKHDVESEIPCVLHDAMEWGAKHDAKQQQSDVCAELSAADAMGKLN
jgi:hypothetical protein